MTKTFAAAQAKQEFGNLLDNAQREPVTITKKGRPVAVVMSMQEYEHFQEVENAYWASQADKAYQEGFLSEADSTKALQKLWKKAKS